MGCEGRQGGAPGKEGGRLTRGRYTLDRRHTPYNRCNWDQVPQRGPAPVVSPRSTPDEGIRADPGAESGSSTALKTGASAGGGRGGGRSLMMLSQPGRPGRTAWYEASHGRRDGSGRRRGGSAVGTGAGRRTRRRPETQEEAAAAAGADRPGSGPKGKSLQAHGWDCSQGADGDCNHETKRRLLLGRKAITSLDRILKSRDITLPTGPSSQNYGFSSSHVWMGELDNKKSWALKNWCFWTVVLEKSLGLQGDQTSQSYRKSVLNIHWKEWCWSWSSNTWATWCKELTPWKEPDAGKDWSQEEKGTTQDKMVGWHHQLDGHEFVQARGVNDGQGSLVSMGCKELDMPEQLNWTDIHYLSFRCTTQWFGIFIHCEMITVSLVNIVTTPKFFL